MKKTQQLLSLLLALVMCMGLLAGCGNTNTSTNTNANSNTAGDGDSAASDDATYTYNIYAANTPTTWNSHDVEVVEFVTDYTEIDLWSLVLNETADGYEWIPEMAVGEPEDITADYAGDEKWGVPAEATEGYVWKVTLNPDAKWEDGTVINADSYIYSMQQALNPDMNNLNASSYYKSMPIYKAENYAKSKQGPEKTVVEDLSTGEHVDYGDSALYISFTNPTSAFWGYTAEDYYGSYADYYVNEAGEDLMTKYGSEEFVPVTDEVIADINYMLMNWWGDSEINPEGYLSMAFYDKTIPVAAWEEVGFLKTGDYELTVILGSPMSEYFFKYYAGNFYLVNEERYEAGKQQTGDMIKTNYGTSAESYMSFGPYKLVGFQADKEWRLERNENWYGWTDGKHEGQFQATNVVCSVVEDGTTAELLFLQGKLDEYSLSGDDLEEYQGSDYIVYSPGTYLYYLNINNDLDSLTAREEEGVNKTILTYEEFRRGISLAMNRMEFVAMQGYGKPMFGYVSDYYVYDVTNGVSYRDSQPAIDALNTFYGVSSEDEITGYDLETARQCLVNGYEQALADGVVTETDKFVFDYPTWTNETDDLKEVAFMQDSLDAAVAGTALEGRITVNMVVSEDYYGRLDAGEYDLCMNGWNGSASNPYGLMQFFATDDASPQSYLGFDGRVETLTINVEGTDVIHTYYDWYTELCQGEYAIADAEVRNEILAAMELALLQKYRDCPFWTSSDASMLSMKIAYPTYDFVFEVGLGGIRYMTFNYTDAEWEAFCAENNNQLNYQ